MPIFDALMREAEDHILSAALAHEPGERRRHLNKAEMLITKAEAILLSHTPASRPASATLH